MKNYSLRCLTGVTSIVVPSIKVGTQLPKKINNKKRDTQGLKKCI